jgi:hypothetical protein
MQVDEEDEVLRILAQVGVRTLSAGVPTGEAMFVSRLASLIKQAMLANGRYGNLGTVN